MAGIEAGVRTEGFTLFQHTIEPRKTASLQAAGIQRMGLGSLP